MGDSDADDRLVAVCRQCGSIYAAKRLQDGRIQPIGSRRGCKQCGARNFAPSPAMESTPEAEATAEAETDAAPDAEADGAPEADAVDGE